MYTRFTPTATIPGVTTRKSAPTTTNFAKGIYTYKPNDTMEADEVRLAQDARFDRVGEYRTRYGLTKLTNPIGYASAWSNDGGTNEDYSVNNAGTYTFTADADKVLYSAKVSLSTVNPTKYAVPMITVSVGGTEIARSCIDPSEITMASQEFEAIFINAPTIHNGDEVVVKITTQDGRPSPLMVSTTGAEHTVVTTLYSATAGAVTNVFEADIEGVKTVLFTQNEKLYRMAADGTVTKIRDLPAGVTKVRFNQDLNKVRYVDGKEGPRLLDPDNSWSDTAITTTDLETEVDLEIKTSNIMDGMSDNIIYFDADTNTQAVWTWPYGYYYQEPTIYITSATISTTIGTTATINTSTLTKLTSKEPADAEVGDVIRDQNTTYAEITAVSGTTLSIKTIEGTASPINSYDWFCRDFRQNFPAILTGDPITAMFNLGGVYYFLTRRNKYQMYAQTADTWAQSACSAQNGTFTQESVVCDLNYAYFANDQGIYVFDGASEVSITQNTIQNVYDAIEHKESIVLDLYKNRLYVFYSNSGDGVNDHCLVYNINLKVWESFDTNAYISATSARQNTSHRFLCGHSKIGMLMLAEDNTNNYNDMGGQIAFNLETAYNHFGATSQLKRISKWRPEFGATDHDYTVQCGYSLDFTDHVKYAFSINLLNNRAITENYVWDYPIDYGVTTQPTIHTTIPKVYNEFYRCQIRYQHIAAYEPVVFRSHTLTIQTQRIR